MLSPVENLPHTVFPPVSPYLDENQNIYKPEKGQNFTNSVDSAVTANQVIKFLANL